MADGRKNDDIKVIKNPLLRQNILLEDIGGLSFLVPADTNKPKFGDNGTNRDGEISSIGEKKQGNEGNPQEAQQFTDIPLDVSEPKENKETSTPEAPPQSNKSDDSLSFGLRSIFPSFAPLLVPPSFKPSTAQEPVKKDHALVKEQLPRHSPLQIVEPELVPPPEVPIISTGSKTQSPLLFPSTIAFNKESTLSSGESPFAHSISPSKSETACSPPPPLSAPPPLSNFNATSGVNPYKLKTLHNPLLASSTVSWGKQSPAPSESIDPIPFFTTPNQAPPLNILTGPQISTPLSSETYSQGVTNSFESSQLYLHNSTPEENKVNNSSVLSSVQNFTSAISNFIAPNRSPDNAEPFAKSSENTSTWSSPVSVNNSVSHYSENIYNNNVNVNSTLDISQHLSHQSVFSPAHPNSNLNQNTLVPTFSYFNNENAAHANASDINSPVPTTNNQQVDNTVCVSAITTAISSSVPSTGSIFPQDVGSSQPDNTFSTPSSQYTTSGVQFYSNSSEQIPIQQPYFPNNSISLSQSNSKVTSDFSVPPPTLYNPQTHPVTKLLPDNPDKPPALTTPVGQSTTEPLAEANIVPQIPSNLVGPPPTSHSAPADNTFSTPSSQYTTSGVQFYSNSSEQIPIQQPYFPNNSISLSQSNSKVTSDFSVPPPTLYNPQTHPVTKLLPDNPDKPPALTTPVGQSTTEPLAEANIVPQIPSNLVGPPPTSHSAPADNTFSTPSSQYTTSGVQFYSNSSEQIPIQQPYFPNNSISLSQSNSKVTSDFSVPPPTLYNPQTHPVTKLLPDNPDKPPALTTPVGQSTTEPLAEENIVPQIPSNLVGPPPTSHSAPTDTGLTNTNSLETSHPETNPIPSYYPYSNSNISSNENLVCNSQNSINSSQDKQTLNSNTTNLIDSNKGDNLYVEEQNQCYNNTIVDNPQPNDTINSQKEDTSSSSKLLLNNETRIGESNEFLNIQGVANKPTTAAPLDRPVPVVQPIPTFNYFSSGGGSCFPPPLDLTAPTKSIVNAALPASSFFKPIEAPNIISPPNVVQPPFVNQTISPSSNNQNPTPKVAFPPPNITCPQKTVTPPTNPQHTSPTQESKPLGELDLEELDQIPLEGSAVPLYNPEYINRKKKFELPESKNSYRLSKGLKKPTYAPVPDLGVSEKKNSQVQAPLASSPTNTSISSTEEMANIEAQSKSHRPSQSHSPKTSPGSSATLEPYYANVLQPLNYRPPYHHWFFKSGRHKKSPWTPFSMADSLNLEQVFTSSDLTEGTKVATDGGRYDVLILNRKKIPVYWEEPAGEVRRCSWFVKSLSESRYTPYDENIAALLEDEYKIGCETNEWNRRIELADGEVIILHSPSAMAHHVRSSSPDAWGSQPTMQQKPRVVKRGVDDFDIPKGEAKQVDHLLLVVHGVGKACDLRFRSLMEVVDDFRSISLQLVQSHFHSGVQNGNVGRVEILPVEWHGALHTETINDRLSAITLPSIPRAREFTNETLLDILFYTSPVFCEKIVQAVGDELNRVYNLYMARNPGFRGQISLSGHSLGSLILFDILCHQQPVQRPHLSTQASLQEEDEEDETVDELGFIPKKSRPKLSRRMSYLTIGPGTGQPYTIYPQLLFQPKAFFALGSPIGMFVTVRGLETLGEEFKFPTCPAFYNIFHPNDPVAYRIEALIKPVMSSIPAVLIPHHKGRKRMHLELKETMTHVTNALKQKLVDSMKNTWNTVYQLALFSRKDNTLPGEVSKAIEDEVLRDGYLDNDPPIGVVGEESSGEDVKVGKLNGGRRIDYVLQEAPLETFNQYISAIRSHLVYWESEDTVLMILKEIYGIMGIEPDTQVPQAILPFDVGGENDTYSEYTYSIGATPTQFVRK